ncbi:MAG: hypothetical protein NTW97_05730 [Candidatus Krumholzibacteria bacterium]|nr:hypothetical protein [Candidatus Krumholzibacteria bacterium]
MDTQRLRFQTIIPLQKYSLILRSDSEKVIDAVRGWVDHDIAHYHTIDESSPRVPIEVELFTSRKPPGIDKPTHLDHMATFEDIKFYSDNGHIILTFGDTSFVKIDPKKGIARGFVSGEHLESPWILSHRIFYVPVLEIIRGMGVCYIHAGCVCRGDKCILLCGGSGHGKSTLTYALARSRYSYLSDDAVFVQNHSRGIEIFSFPEKIKLDTNSRSFFPEFDGFEKSPGKMEIPLKLTKIKNIAVSGSPHALIFTRIIPAEKSELVPLPRSEAMLRLIGQSISLTSKRSIESNLDLLMKLTGSLKSFELKMGGTFEGVPELIEETLFA